MNKYRNLMDDMCVCRSTDCPKYKECYRGDGYERPEGVYTVSLLAQICNETNNYELFIGEKND